MNVLISNDDGVWAPGLRELASAMRKVGKVTVVAPQFERSTSGHSLTLHKPLRIEEISERTYAVNGTPADCVYLALKCIMKKEPPDLVLSGINHGANLGNDVHYSGTVAAAREAAFDGFLAIAVSLFSKDSSLKPNYPLAAQFVARLAKVIVKKSLPQEVFLNVNIPNVENESQWRGVKSCIAGHRIYSEQVVENRDPRGKKYYWIGGAYQGFLDTPDTDCKAVDESYISVTPLHVNATEYRFISEVTGWDLSCKSL